LAFLIALFQDSLMVNFVAIDFETANNDRASACAVGVVRLEGGRIVATERRLINPRTNYFIYTDCHNMRPQDVADAPLFDLAWKELSPLLDGAAFIAAHNAHFDKGVLYHCCDRYNIAPPGHPVTCSMKAARACWELPAYGLDTVCNHLSIELNHHEPLSDALGCARIMVKAMENGYKV
jgi:DNA polymerase III subunit epsilon